MRAIITGVSFNGVGNYVANNTITHAPHTAITGGGNENLFGASGCRLRLDEALQMYSNCLKHSMLMK